MLTATMVNEKIQGQAPDRSNVVQLFRDVPSTTATKPYRDSDVVNRVHTGIGYFEYVKEYGVTKRYFYAS